jgi:hypothetical protein
VWDYTAEPDNECIGLGDDGEESVENVWKGEVLYGR